LRSWSCSVVEDLAGKAFEFGRNVCVAYRDAVDDDMVDAAGLVGNELVTVGKSATETVERLLLRAAD